jgi:heat shock protein HtpX
MKRIVLYLLTNVAVLVVLTVVLRVLGLDRFLTAEGIDYRALLGFSVVVGFTGSIISLLMSKTMAKRSTGAQVIDGSENADARWLVDTVRRHTPRPRARRRAERICDGRLQEFGARRGVDWAPAVHESRGSRGGAGA